MIPFKLLAVMRPTTRPVFCSLTSGSLLASRRASFRGRLAPESLARLFALQPRRLLLAALLMVVLAVASTALSILHIEPSRPAAATTDATVDTTFAPALDRVDAVDLSRWQF